MVKFMLNDPGKKILSGKFPGFTMQILGANKKPAETFNLGGVVDDTQAALFLTQAAFLFDYFRVDQDQGLLFSP